ncbi:MAG: 50S ribosomal protein L11 methyltransferase, partial [Bacteroidales bacterium]|nr:50S ribosomal protein L11 methyltransferase [Bacteroidales bacterium]
MNYTAIHFKLKDPTPELREIIIAELDLSGFEGFLETEEGVVGYIPNEQFYKINLQDLMFMIISNPGDITIEKEFIIDKNWNELWEKNYNPVIIAGKVLIKAPFHKTDREYPIQLVIEPKMSFGTGHHETTSLVVETMLEEDFNQKTVLDMGCGTGILAFMASKLGAASVIAVDLNEWAYENTIENAERNDIKNIKVELGDIDVVKNKKFDIILANITRNVILEQTDTYSFMINPGGTLILSGILISDLDVIKEAASRIGFNYLKTHPQKRLDS